MNFQCYFLLLSDKYFKDGSRELKASLLKPLPVSLLCPWLFTKLNYFYRVQYVGLLLSFYSVVSLKKFVIKMYACGDEIKVW